jgi:trans-aconitate methyltransferase
MDLKETEILGDHVGDHWYYRSKALALESLLGELPPCTMLDIGAGSGFFSRYMLANSAASRAICVDNGYKIDSDSKEGLKPIMFRRSVEQVDAELVLMIDVLEHVEDDIKLLQQYIAKVPQGAKFLISVPAFQFLWSEHDVYLEHKRRYTLKGLEDIAQQAGLRIHASAYFYGLIFPVAAIFRLLSRIRRKGPESNGSHLSKHSFFINSALAAICKTELMFMKYNRAAGLSALCLAEKT